jgi:hypothetical protein
MHVDVGYKKRNVKFNIVIPRGDKKKNQKTDKIEREINQKNWTMKKNLIKQLENPKKNIRFGFNFKNLKQIEAN